MDPILNRNNLAMHQSYKHAALDFVILQAYFWPAAIQKHKEASDNVISAAQMLANGSLISNAVCGSTHSGVV